MAQREGSWRLFQLGLVAIFMLCGVGFWVCWGDGISAWMTTRELQETFGDRLPDYYGQANEVIAKSGGVDCAPRSPTRAGKALWVHIKEVVRRSSRERSFKVDPDAGKFPAEFRADTPEEVQTVVLVYEDTFSEGTYVSEHGVSGPDARSRRVDVRVVDIKNKKYLARKVFEYGAKRTITAGESGAAKRDTEQLMEWYMALPAGS